MWPFHCDSGYIVWTRHVIEITDTVVTMIFLTKYVMFKTGSLNYVYRYHLYSYTCPINIYSRIQWFHSWWRCQMKAFSVWLGFCEGNPPVTGRFFTKASDAELWWFIWSAPEQTVEQTLETLVIWDAIAFIMTSLQYNVLRAKIKSHWSQRIP